MAYIGFAMIIAWPDGRAAPNLGRRPTTRTGSSATTGYVSD